MAWADNARDAVEEAGQAAAVGRQDREAGWIPLLVFGGVLMLSCPLAVHVDRPWFRLPFWILIGPVAYMLVGFWGRRRTEALGVQLFSGRRPQGCGVLIVLALGALFPYPLVWGVCDAVLLGVIAASLRSGVVRLAAVVVMLVGGVAAQLIASQAGSGSALVALYGLLGAALAAWGAVWARRPARS